MSLCHLLHTVNDAKVVVFGPVVLATRDLISRAARSVGCPGGTCQMAGGQRAVGHERDTRLFAEGDQVLLVLPVEQVVMVLHGAEGGPTVVLGDFLHVLKLAGVHGRGAQRSHLAGLDQIVERFHGLLDWRFIVEPVDDIEVQVVGAQPLERPLDLPMDGLGRKSPLIEIDLGCNDHPVAACMLSKRLSQVLLTGSSGVAVGRIEEGDAQIECVRNDRVSPLLVQCSVMHGAWFAEAHAPHAVLRYIDARFAQLCVLHLSPLGLPWCRCNHASKFEPVEVYLRDSRSR